MASRIRDAGWLESATGDQRQGDTGRRTIRREPHRRRGMRALLAALESAGRMRRRVTFSRNLTLSLSRTCRCYCKYCSFATHQPHLHAPGRGRATLLDGAVVAPPRQGAAASSPASGPEAQPPRSPPGSPQYGHRGLHRPPWPGCASGRSSAACLPHTNLGVLPKRGDLGAPAGRRDRVAGADARASVAERLMDTVHAELCRPEHPARPIETIAAAGGCVSRSRAGSSSGSARPRTSGSRRSRSSRGCTSATGTSQEVILQNFVPHQSYYGREPAEIAGEAALEDHLADRGRARPAAAGAELGLAGHARGHEAADRARERAASRRGDPGAGRENPQRLYAKPQML